MSYLDLVHTHSSDLIGSLSKPNQWIVLFVHSDWLFKLGRVFAILCWRCEGRKQNGFLACYHYRKGQILAINEAAVPENCKKATKIRLVQP